MHRRLQLAREDVDLGLGEVGQAAGVVGVEVGGDDAAHVAGGEAERLDLLQRRLGELAPAGASALKATPSRRGSRVSSMPKPVSTRTSPSSVSISRQWQTTVGRAPAARPRRRAAAARVGQSVPQLRWWMRIGARRSLLGADRAPCALSLAARRSGGTGIRDRLKIDCPNGLVGSSPTSGIARLSRPCSGRLRGAVLGRGAGAVVFAGADRALLLDVPLLVEAVEGGRDQDDLQQGEDDDEQADQRRREQRRLRSRPCRGRTSCRRRPRRRSPGSSRGRRRPAGCRGSSGRRGRRRRRRAAP